MQKRLRLTVLDTAVAICRLPADAVLPEWALRKQEFLSITRTSEELSIVCVLDAVPTEVQAERGWRVFKVQGPLDFGLTGILASIAVPLAGQKISIFAISTYDTDYILVRQEAFELAREVLSWHFEIV